MACHPESVRIRSQFSSTAIGPAASGRTPPAAESIDARRSITGSDAGSYALRITPAKPRPVTVKAIDNVETLLVPRSAFMKLANQAPDLAAKAADRIRQELVGYLGEIERVKAKIGSSKG